jgi:hypothetical protein
LSNHLFKIRRAFLQVRPLAFTKKAWKPGAATVPQERVAAKGAPEGRTSASSSETVTTVRAIPRT